MIAAGLRRVVACMQDPNPLVSGQGFAKLREAGVNVASGILEEEAKELNEPFAKYIRTRTPLITLKAAMTLDGKIAPPPSESHNPTALGAGGATGGWITSEPARAHVQQLRHQHDAIMVGVGTIVADDPLLTDRTGKPRRRSLLRVIMDSKLRLPLTSRVVKTAQSDVVVLCSFAEEKRKRQLQDHGIRVEQIPSVTVDGRPDMAGIARRLGEMEITSLLIEGGAMIMDGAGFWPGGQSVSRLRSQDSRWDRLCSICGGRWLSSHERCGAGKVHPSAPLRRRLCGRRVSKGPVSGGSN